MQTISTEGISPQKKLFHNEKIDVYPMTLPLEKIHYWGENNRTIFTFERLIREKDTPLDKLSIEEITTFVAQQNIHKLQELADSIKRNGVQVPLIIRDDGILLDGNRRYFACQWIQIQSIEQNTSIPSFLQKIPALIIRKTDLLPIQELKILAEANFIPDLKVPWSLDAQARAVEGYYEKVPGKENTDFLNENALRSVTEVFGITLQRAKDLLETLKLTKVFINGVSNDINDEERIKRRLIVEDKFVYFWEFLNKSTKGRSKFYDPSEFNTVRDMFFDLMSMGRDSPIKNVKQIEPLVQAKRDRTAWSMMEESHGAKLNVVVSMINEKKEVRKAEDKIRAFLEWLKELEDINELTPKAKSYLQEVAHLATEKGQD